MFGHKILYPLLCLFLLSCNGFCITKDTIPPTGRLINPENLSVITGNVIRLSAQAEDKESGVKAVYFYANYYEWLDSSMFGHIYLIAKITSPPYEFICDISHIPDQSYIRMYFTCSIKDSAGNVRDMRKDKVWVVVDRNPVLKSMTLTSLYTTKPPNIDGDPKEWDTGLDWQYFANSDNIIFFTSMWDDANVYFFVKVIDQNILYTRTPEIQESTASDYMEVMSYDAVEFFFDVNHDHSSLIERSDREILVGAGGASLSVLVDPDKHFSEYKLDSNIRYKVSITKGLNVASSDNYYSVEIAFPWTYLGKEPSKSVCA